jgi:hypothetical protein
MSELFSHFSLKFVVIIVFLILLTSAAGCFNFNDVYNQWKSSKNVTIAIPTSLSLNTEAHQTYSISTSRSSFKSIVDGYLCTRV